MYILCVALLSHRDTDLVLLNEISEANILFDSWMETLMIQCDLIKNCLFS